ncbi:MAG: hypothetical protein AAGA48_35050 [Myxococcota bacterium]
MMATLIVAAALGAPRLQPVAEIGTVWIAINDLQLGRQGTPLDLAEEAGQDRLFPSVRLRLDLAHGPQRRNRFSLSYQPLELNTRSVTTRDWRIRNQTFAAGTPMDIGFGFSFFRATWQRDVLKAEDWTLGLGANLQFRTSSLVFFAADGSRGVSQQEFGPVPSVLVRLRRDTPGAFFEAELSALPVPLESAFDGFYELNLRAGLKDERGFEPYLVLRGLGGGFEGGSDGAFADSGLLAFVLGAGAAIR